MIDPIIIKVPRHLIKGISPEIELGSGQIVTLINGMVTDVHVDYEGNLITKTNDDDLIDYLKDHSEDPLITLKRENVKLVTLTHKDARTVYKWYEKPNAYQRIFTYMFELGQSYFDIEKQVAFSNLNNSQCFMIYIKRTPTGLINLVNRKNEKICYIDLKIYLPELITDKITHTIFDLIIKFIKDRYKAKYINGFVLKHDDTVNKMFINYGFSFSETSVYKKMPVKENLFILKIY